MHTRLKTKATDNNCFVQRQIIIIIIIISDKLIKFIKLFCYVLSVCRLCSDALASILDTRDVFLSLITLAKAVWILLCIARNRHLVLLIVTILSLCSI